MKRWRSATTITSILASAAVLALARESVCEGVAAIRPGAGIVFVWPHHVGEIWDGPDKRGRWLVHSGNDGNAVRTRWRSLFGVIAFRWVQ